MMQYLNTGLYAQLDSFSDTWSTWILHCKPFVTIYATCINNFYTIYQWIITFKPTIASKTSSLSGNSQLVSSSSLVGTVCPSSGRYAIATHLKVWAAISSIAFLKQSVCKLMKKNLSLHMSVFKPLYQLVNLVPSLYQEEQVVRCCPCSQNMQLRQFRQPLSSVRELKNQAVEKYITKVNIAFKSIFVQ